MDTFRPLGDITNRLHQTKKRLADGTIKKYASARKPRKVLDVSFDTDEEKTQFDNKLKRAKKKLDCNSNEALLSKLLDQVIYEKTAEKLPSKRSTKSDESGNFICSKKKLFELVTNLQNNPSDIVTFEQVGHVAVIQLTDNEGRIYQWASSALLKSDYEINHNMVHAYLCAGIRAVQYKSLCTFAKLGQTTGYFRRKLINVYSEAVDRVKTRGINAAMDLEKASSDEGLRIITDARHACRKNSFHTDVVTIGYETHRVIHYEHVTKDDERCSQKHEVHGSRKMYESFHQREIKVSAPTNTLFCQIFIYKSTKSLIRKCPMYMKRYITYIMLYLYFSLVITLCIIVQ